MKSILLFTILFLNASILFSQEVVQIKKNKQFYIYGSTTVIGNNIVSEHATKPFNDHFVMNDKLKMTYVDIDDDPSTFSSSQATLRLPENKTKIVYAVLYWSAIYKYDKGLLKRQGNTKKYKGDISSRDNIVNEIKLKMPNNSYQTVIGEVIYDDFEKDVFPNNTPYACYADITNLLQGTSPVNGDYTVANIKATQGYVSGGCSGGWLLYVVYEAPTKQPVYVTTYNGFIQVNKQNHSDIVFKDFKTKEEGFVKTYLTLAALEGDQKLKTDQCLLFNPIDSTYVALGNSVRDSKNLFNSKITYNEFDFEDRNPLSTNTLGFDLLQMQVPNPNNELISNDVNQITMRIKTKADRFYLFFTAFQTEISLLNYNENIDKIQEAEVVAISTDKEAEKIIKESDSTKVNAIDISETGIITDLYDTNLNPEIRDLKITSYTVPSLKKGFYLVTNVFSIPSNTINWVAFLKTKGYKPKIFINPVNNWEYVYVFYSEDIDLIYNRFKALSPLSYFNDIWISKINLPD